METMGGVTIRVVDDGSGSHEVDLLEKLINGLMKSHACLHPLLALPLNLGKGGAVYAGFQTAAADTEWLAFVDADGSITAAEVQRVMEMVRELGPVSTAFFGSRIKMLGRNVDRQLKRHLVGRVYATLVSELLNIPVYDSQCGLKLVPRAAYERIRERLEIQGFAFDVELMTALLDSGCDVVEVPIDWHETPGGKVHLLRDSWRMFRDILNIRANHPRLHGSAS